MGCDNNMSRLKGQLFRLYVEIDSVFTLLAALRSTTMTLNNEAVDVTDKDGSLWKTLLQGAGVESISIKASGICNNSASFLFIRSSVMTGTFINAKLESNLNEIYTGAFKITSMESLGEYNKEEIFSLTLDSSAQTVRTISDFRLLEDGGYRLLEDGSRRLLEAA
jgi:TP901-1 family phage major tail protein